MRSVVRKNKQAFCHSCLDSQGFYLLFMLTMPPTALTKQWHNELWHAGGSRSEWPEELLQTPFTRTLQKRLAGSRDILSLLYEAWRSTETTQKILMYTCICIGLCVYVHCNLLHNPQYPGMIDEKPQGCVEQADSMQLNCIAPRCITIAFDNIDSHYYLRPTVHTRFVPFFFFTNLPERNHLCW